jgi:CCR4-NOT transcription complex subunit 1
LFPKQPDLLNAIVSRIGISNLSPELQAAYNSLEADNSYTMNPLNNLIKSQFSKPGPKIKSTDLAFAISKLSSEPSNADLTELIILLSHNPSWDGDIIGSAVKSSKFSHLDWNEVFLRIELPTQFNNNNVVIALGDAGSLLNVLKFLAAADEGLIYKFFSIKWTNLDIQIKLVSSCVYLTPDFIDLKSHGLEQIINPNDFINASPQIQSIAAAISKQPLNFTALIKYSLQALSPDNPHLSAATTFLDNNAKLFPELFFLGGVVLPKPWSPLIERVMQNFFELFLIGHTSSPLIFYRLAQVNKEYFVDSLLQFFPRDPNLILNVAQEAKVLNDALSSKQYNMVLELAALSDKHNLLSFGSFLKENVRYKGPDFVRALLDFIDVKAALEYSQSQTGNGPPGLNLRSVAAALQVLNAVDIPHERTEQYKAIQIQCLQSYPRLINYGQGYDEAILSHGDSNSFSPDVERKMKMHYQKMYEQQIEIRDIITMLQRLKQSSNPYDQDVFACMVHSLFDEYRFFPEYPLNALATTAVLFGSLVYFQLIDGMPLSIALRFILDSLRQPVDSNMFKFGLQALFEFRERLPEFPKYCHILLEIPGLAIHQQFYQQIKDIVNRLDDSSQNTIIFSSINADLAVPDEAIQEEPQEAVRDKVLFIVNNVAANNIQNKAKELVSILDKKYYRWFAGYIVGQRAKLEPNYHSLYINMLQILGSKGLELYFVKVTYSQIVKLINNPDTPGTPEKRNLLKNLGQWLGRLLLARNKPILHKNIAFKKLLCEGFDSQTLVCVLPFVCKILEKTAESSVFKPPNPWLMGILKVLVELYQYADLTLNLKFEVEVLCNSLRITLEDIEPSVIIRNHLAQDDIDGSQTLNLNNDMHKLNLDEYQNNANTQVLQAPSQPTPQIQASQISGLSANSPQFNENSYIELVHHLGLEGVTILVIHPALKKVFLEAIEKALREVLQLVVERSANMACYSTSALVLKDFALEPDEHKLRRAAQKVVERLAGNIAMVTAKDLLRESLSTHVRSNLINNGYTEKNIPSDQVELAINDNIDLICSIVERASVDRSLIQIEEALQPAFLSRKRFFESGTNQPFADQVSNYALQLPDPFKLKVGGLDPQQFSIYEDFGSAQNTYEPRTDIQSLPSGAPVSQAGQSFPQIGLDPQPFDTADPRAFEIIASQIQGAIDSIPALAAESNEKSLKQLTPEHAISVLLSQILVAVDRNTLREQLIARASEVTVTALFQSENSFAREILSSLLEQLCNLSSTASKEITFWLLFAKDPRKLNPEVTLAILRSGLISCADLDVSLSKEIKAKSEAVIPFAIDLITSAVLGPDPIALRADFAATLEALEEIDNEDPQHANVAKLMESLSNNVQIVPAKASEDSSSAQSLAEQMRFIFAEWVRLSQHPSRNERQFSSFIYQLSKHEILSKPQYAISFTRMSFEFALKSYSRGPFPESLPISDEPFIALDALAKLISDIIFSFKGEDLKASLAYAQRILSVISLVLIEHHEKLSDQFNEQPYFRFFSSLFYELNLAEEKSTELVRELYLLIADILKPLQPFAVPGFSFAWMSLISHRYYLPKLLEIPNKKGWSHIIDFLCELLDFEGTYAQGRDFPKAITVMYQGTSRIFLALLTDCPQLFIEYHYILCKHIPSSFVQIRNLVLSAFPEKMVLPDPLTQGLKVDRLPEIKEIPIFAVDPTDDMQRLGLKKLVDLYIKSASPAVLKGIASGFKLPSPKADSGLGFDVVTQDAAAFNTFVFYIGIKAVSGEKEKTNAPSSAGDDEEPLAQFNRDSPYLALLSNLLLELSVEGRYFLCEAMANQLRYPNRHTHFFSCVILSLFGNYGTGVLGNSKVDIRHIITRVLLERIICNRPHPWGLMITFTELLKNSNYKIFDLPFTKSTPEIERMFSSLYEHISSDSAAQAAINNSASTDGSNGTTTTSPEVAAN